MNQQRRKAQVIDVKPSQILEMQEKVLESQQQSTLVSKKLILMAACALWLFVGTIFYALHDKFGWSVALYQSVNIGWSIGWRMPFTPEQYGSFGSKLFSLFHNSVGVMFSGIAVIYIAAELSANKDTWLTQMVKEEALELAADTEGYWDDILAFLTLNFHKFKVVLFLFLWGFLGVVAVIFFVPEYDTGTAVEFIFSVLTGAGYMTIPDEDAKYKFVLCAVYAALGIPLLIISMGLVMSYLFTNPDEDAVYKKIIAPLSPEEIEFMKMFGIDDGDGTLDIKEFIILTAVRIGGVSPGLITIIADRFKELDRGHQKSIAYEDIVSGYSTRKVAPINVGQDISPIGHHSRRVAPEVTTKDIKSKSNQRERSVSVNKVSPLLPLSRTALLSPESEGKEQEVMMIEDLEAGEEVLSVRHNSFSSCDSVMDKLDDTREPVVVAKARSGSGSEGAEDPSINDLPLGRDRRAAGDRVNAKTLQHIQKVKKAQFIASQLSVRRREGLGEGQSFEETLLAKAKLLSFRVYSLFQNAYLQAFLIWLIWLLAGAIFYTLTLDKSFCYGFFTSVSVGYGIYWHSLDDRAVIVVAYSAVHLLLGSAMIGLAMAAFASSLTAATSDWYTESLRKVQLQAASESDGYWDDITAAISYYGPKFKIHFVFVLYSLVGIIWSCVRFGWSFLDGFYFSWCCLSTGGFLNIPEDSTDSDFFLVALYSSMGAPIMAVTFGLMAHSLSNIYADTVLQHQINSSIVVDELEMAKKVGIEDGDGRMDASEYIILILVRIGALSPDLIGVISMRFRVMDVTGKGSISYEQMKREKSTR